MSLESNRTDFEKVLKDANEMIEEIQPFLESSVVEPFKTMIEEYENHYSNDIDDMLENVWQLENTIDVLTDRVEILENENIELENKNAHMEGIISKYEN